MLIDNVEVSIGKAGMLKIKLRQVGAIVVHSGAKMRKINIATAWRTYFFLLIAYLISLLILKYSAAPDFPPVIEIGALLFVVGAMYLIMLTTLEEQRRSTNRHVEILEKSFERQTKVSEESAQQVVSELKGLKSFFEKAIVEVKRKVEEIKEVEEKRRIDEERRIERIKPDFYVYISERSHWLLWRHYWLTVHNTGGRARNVSIEHRFHPEEVSAKVRSFLELSSKEEKSFDIGDVDVIKRRSDSIIVSASANDQEMLQYRGDVKIDLGLRQWMRIELKKAED